jgi:hypothetical protein
MYASAHSCCWTFRRNQKHDGCLQYLYCQGVIWRQGQHDISVSRPKPLRASLLIFSHLKDWRCSCFTIISMCGFVDCHAGPWFNHKWWHMGAMACQESKSGWRCITYLIFADKGCTVGALEPDLYCLGRSQGGFTWSANGNGKAKSTAVSVTTCNAKYMTSQL